MSECVYNDCLFMKMWVEVGDSFLNFDFVNINGEIDDFFEF